MKLKKEKEKKNLVTGYFKLFIICISTVFLVLLLRTWYLNRINYQLNVSIIRETLNREIKPSEVYNYIREDENAIIYIGVITDEKCREYEEILNEIVREKHLENTITYLNLTDEDNTKKFFKEFNKFYNTDLTAYPAIIVFNGGKVKDILNNKVLTKDETLTFLRNNNIVSVDY